MATAYDEFVEFIASGPPASAVATWQLSEAGKRHVADLIERERDGRLTADEQDELRHVLEFEHLMRLAKARARARVARP